MAILATGFSCLIFYCWDELMRELSGLIPPLFCALCLGLGPSVWAADSSSEDNVLPEDNALLAPLDLSDRNPLVQLHGLPGAHSGAVLASMQSEWRLAFDVGNEFYDQTSGGEHLALDGETRRTSLGWRLGLGDGWEVGLQVPLIEQSGGNLDSFIEGWHRFFSLPDGGRPEAPRNQLRYLYQRDGQTPLDFQRAGSGIGDVQLTVGWQLGMWGPAPVALLAAVNLPTGDADRLTGSGATSTDIALAVSAADWLGSGLNVFANAGGLWLAQGDVLPEYQRDQVWHLAAGLGWPVSDAVALKLQLDAHTALYRSDLRPLGADSLQLTMGGSARLSGHWLLDIGVGEDIRVDTAPDVTLQLALRWLQ